MKDSGFPSARCLLRVVGYFKKGNQSFPWIVEVALSWLAALLLGSYLGFSYVCSIGWFAKFCGSSENNDRTYQVPLTTIMRSNNKESSQRYLLQLKNYLVMISQKKENAKATSHEWSDEELIRLLRSSVEARRIATSVMQSIQASPPSAQSCSTKLATQLKQVWPDLLKLPSMDDKLYPFDITLVIPAYGERGEHIRSNLQKALSNCVQPERVQVVLVDAGRNIEIQKATNFNDNKSWGDVKIIPFTNGGGRGPTLNYGAKHGDGRIVTFLHSDNSLPFHWDQHITSVFASTASSQPVACAFSFTIDTSIGDRPTGVEAAQWLGTLRTKCFHVLYGDSVLSIPSSYFRFIGGYPEQALMEDYEVMYLLRKRASCLPNETIEILPSRTLISPRRWQANGVIYVILFNCLCVFLYEHRQWSPTELYQFYYQDRSN